MGVTAAGGALKIVTWAAGGRFSSHISNRFSLLAAAAREAFYSHTS